MSRVLLSFCCLLASARGYGFFRYKQDLYSLVYGSSAAPPPSRCRVRLCLTQLLFCRLGRGLGGRGGGVPRAARAAEGAVAAVAVGGGGGAGARHGDDQPARPPQLAQR